MRKILHLLAIIGLATVAFASDPLPSWNDTAPKRAILSFVAKVTTPGSADFVPGPERIATFDNDGTLWTEQPLYFQFFFVFARIKHLAPQHPEWQTTEPYASLLKGDMQGVLAGGEKGVLELMTATHSGLSTEEFEQAVNDWVATAKHPKTGRRFTEMTYQPMLEVLAYFRANGFKNFIVSGGGIEFMRPWSGENPYGIPPEQVIGTSGGLKYEVNNGVPVIMKLPTLVLMDDKEGKPVGIQRHIGRRPILAFGNSATAISRCSEWTTAGKGTPARRLFTIPMPSANTPTTATRISANLPTRPRCGACQTLDRRQHEGRLGRDLPADEIATLSPAHSYRKTSTTPRKT